MAVLIHAAFISRSQTPAHGGRVIAQPSAMVVRTVTLKAAEVSRERIESGRPAVTEPDARSPAEPQPLLAQAVPVVPALRSPDIPAPSPSRRETRHPQVTVAADASGFATMAVPAGVPMERPLTVLSLPAPAAPQGLPSAPDYLLAARLDPGPSPLDEINPAYPDTMEQRSGSVVLRVLISEAGDVDNVAVVRSNPPGIFEQVALTAFAQAKFSPGRLLGSPVKSQITVEVEFTPLNRGARVSGRSY